MIKKPYFFMLDLTKKDKFNKESSYIYITMFDSNTGVSIGWIIEKLLD